MFLSRGQAKEQISKIIWDKSDNDIVFVVGSRGIGKTRLLDEIYHDSVEKRNLIVADGASVRIEGASSLKRSFVEGILRALRQKNSSENRYKVCRLIGGEFLSSIRLFIDTSFFRKKEGIRRYQEGLCSCSLIQLKNLYCSLVGNHPLVLLVSGRMTSEEIEYYKGLQGNTTVGRVTYVISLRATREHIHSLRAVVEVISANVYIFPLLPERHRSADKNHPEMLAEFEFAGKDAKDSRIVEADESYINTYDLVCESFSVKNSPATVYILANQEMGNEEYVEVNKIAKKIYQDDTSGINDQLILPYNGKVLWMDALAYFLALDLHIDKAIQETQSFFLTLIMEIAQSSAIPGKPLFSDHVRIKLSEKTTRNEFVDFIKKASANNGNVFADGFAKYYADFATLVKAFFKNEILQTGSFEQMIPMVEVLDRAFIEFSDTNLNAMTPLYVSSQAVSVLDEGYKMLEVFLQGIQGTGKVVLPQSTMQSIRSFVKLSIMEYIKWFDVDLMNEMVEFIKNSKEKKMNFSCDLNLIKEFGEVPDCCDLLYERLIENNLEWKDLVEPCIRVFLSYSHSKRDVTIVDLVDKYLQCMGVYVLRDEREILTFDDIVEYMDTIREADGVVLIISDNYLRKEWCLYEVVQMLKCPDYKRRAFPFLIPLSPQEQHERRIEQKTENMLSVEYQKEIYSYWCDYLDKYLDGCNANGLVESRGLVKNSQRINDIKNSIDDFMDFFRTHLLAGWEKEKRISEKEKKIKEQLIVVVEKLRQEQNCHEE